MEPLSTACLQVTSEQECKLDCLHFLPTNFYVYFFISICFFFFFENKLLCSRSDFKQRNRKPLSSTTHSSKETGKTRFDGKINTAVGRYKTTQPFLDKKDDNFSWMKLGLPLPLMTLRTFTFNVPVSCPLRRADGNEVPNSHWLSKRFRNLPHLLKTSGYFQLWQTTN